MTHPSPDTVLEVVNLTKHFGSLTAVSNVSLRIGEGVHSIIGPNGAGKTTFFNLLSGFLTPDEGKIFYRGSDITGLAPYEVSQLGIGRSFQITSIFPALSVYENIRVAAQSRVSALQLSRFQQSTTRNRGISEANPPGRRPREMGGCASEEPALRSAAVSGHRDLPGDRSPDSPIG